MSFFEGIGDALKTAAEAVLLPFEKLQPDNTDTDPDSNNSFELAATAVEAASSIPVRIYKTVGDAIDNNTGNGLINGAAMAVYIGSAMIPGYVAVLPMWLTAAALRGIGEKLDN